MPQQDIAVALSKAKEARRRRRLWLGGSVDDADEMSPSGYTGDKEADLDRYKGHKTELTSGEPGHNDDEFIAQLRRRKRSFGRGSYT